MGMSLDNVLFAILKISGTILFVVISIFIIAVIIQIMRGRG